MKTPVYFILLGALLLVSFSGKEAEKKAKEGGAISHVVIKDKRLLKTYHPYGYKLDITYPQIWCRQPEVSFDMNNFVHIAISKATDTFTKMAHQHFLKEGSYHTFQINYQVLYSAFDLVSIRFSGEAHFIGDAKVMKYTETLNYDLGTREFPKFNEVFENEYEQALVKIIKKYYNIDVPVSDLREDTRFGFEEQYLLVSLSNSTDGKYSTYKLPWSSLDKILAKGGVGDMIIKANKRY